ncbi:MAG: OmpA family protein [Polyangiaceae bacterium]|nr:OmpA family protein [Polyangiaceae bacterium]
MKRVNAIVLAALVAGSTGCSTTVVYEGKQPIAIAGESRPPRISKRALRAALKNKRIEIQDKVQFELDQAIIKPESHGLLNDVAQVIKENPQIKHVEIQGHASADGDDAHNMDLSDRRAKAVREYLISQGIDGSRLVGKGYGETQALGDNNTQEGREKNRRVEFHVDEAPTAAESGSKAIKK